MKTKLVIAILVLCLAGGSAMAAKAKPKPKPKPKAPTTHHETMGTEQLKGEYGEIGHTYTLGKASPWNFRLNSVEYSVDTIKLGDRIVYPNSKQKLLVLRYTVHNPQKSEAQMRFDTIRFTAVDANDQNCEYAGAIATDDGKFNTVDMQMKPAQKKDILTVIVLPAEGQVPKLMVTNYDEDGVIRYDLRGKIKPLAAPFADPKDEKGCTAVETVPAQFGTAYPLGLCSLKVEEISYRDTAIKDEEPPEGGKFLIATCTAKCLNTYDVTFRFDTFIFKVKDADGVPIDCCGNMIRASSDADLDMSLKPDQEMRFRTYIPIEKGVTPKTLTVSEEEGRAFEYQLP